jgi:hypothetical protein
VLMKLYFESGPKQALKWIAEQLTEAVRVRISARIAAEASQFQN